MRFVYRNPELEQQLAQAKTMDALNAGLQALGRLIPSFFSPEIYGRQIYCEGLDALVPRMLNKLSLPTVELPKSNDNVCILATAFYSTGGHSRVAGDISTQLGADRVTIILTNSHTARPLTYASLVGANMKDSEFQRRSLLSLSAPTLAERIVELHALLSAIRPSRIILMCNHMDAVAVTGAWAFRSVTDFVHHADHLPALGATLGFSAHVDLNWPVHLACREAGLNPVYAAMNVNAAGASRDKSAHEGLRLATCGSLIKYRHPGRHRWTDYVLSALGVGGVSLFHVGPVDDAFRAEVSAALTGAGIDPERYIYLGGVPNLGAALEAHDIDIFLGSYPTSGGRANLEAMAAGLPAIVAHDPEAPPLIPDRWPLPQFVSINSPAELPGLLADPAGLIEAARSPASLDAVAIELGRFRDYVDGRPLAPLPADEVLPD